MPGFRRLRQKPLQREDIARAPKKDRSSPQSIQTSPNAAPAPPARAVPPRCTQMRHIYADIKETMRKLPIAKPENPSRHDMEVKIIARSFSRDRYTSEVSREYRALS